MTRDEGNTMLRVKDVMALFYAFSFFPSADPNSELSPCSTSTSPQAMEPESRRVGADELSRRSALKLHEPRRYGRFALSARYVITYIITIGNEPLRSRFRLV